MRSAILAVTLLFVGLASIAPAQEEPPAPEATPPPGRFRLGPVYLTPSFRISSLGLDTNVFYTATNRRTDFIAHGGPGLQLVIPLHGALKLRGDGTLGYLYYAKTESQRRLTGSGMGRLAYEGLRLNAGAQASYLNIFNRLGMEVNRRVAQDEREVQADVRYRIGARFAMGASGRATRLDVDDNQEFFGADLRTNLTRDSFLGEGTLSYALTPKTAFVVEGDHQADRFTLDPSRDTDSNRLGGGFVVTSTTVLSGRVVAGARSIRVVSLPDQDRVVPYADVDVVYHFGPRTLLGVAYSRDVNFSAFAVAEGDLPTMTTELAVVRLEKGLWRNLDLHLHAGLTRFETDAPVHIETPSQGALSIQRNDRVREAGADLGYAFWSRFRIGFAATYTERRSQVADLGIEGLLLGGTITFIPK
jgi:hypothetical protein